MKSYSLSHHKSKLQYVTIKIEGNKIVRNVSCSEEMNLKKNNQEHNKVSTNYRKLFWWYRISTEISAYTKDKE